MIQRISMFSVALLTLSMLVGCSNEASVSGTVSGGGKVVEGGNIIFKPQTAGVKPAAGGVQPDGTFVLKTSGNRGLVPGNYTVLFSAPLPVESDEMLGAASPWRDWKAPSDPVSVKPGKNEFSIELSQ